MSVNKVILLGNVGKDPEVRYLDSGIAVASFPLATSDRAYTLANGTQVPERTEWHNLVLWRGLAETAEKYRNNFVQHTLYEVIRNKYRQANLDKLIELWVYSLYLISIIKEICLTNFK